MSVEVCFVRTVVAAQFALELTASTMVLHVLRQVGLLGRGKGAHVALVRTDVPVCHDVSLKVPSVHGDVITVPTLARLLG